MSASREQGVADLAMWRAEIERVDRELVALLAERLALGQRTAALKQSLGRPVLDPSREAAVVRNAAALAREHGLPEEAVREIFWRIVGMVRGAEERG